MTKLDLLPLLQSALGQPIGLVLRTNDPLRAKAALYRARAEHIGDFPELGQIQIRTSPFPDGDLVLCKSGPKAQKPKEQNLLDFLDSAL